MLSNVGRGTGPNECQGNIKFRALVRQVLQRADLSKLDGRLKAKMAKEILHSVKSRNGRFLRANFQEATGRRSYVEVPDSVALDKIKQSFRHQLRVLGEAPTHKERQLRMSQGVAGIGGALGAGLTPAQLGSCASLQAALAVQRPLDLLSLASLTSAGNAKSQGNTDGNALLNAYNLLPREATSSNSALAHLYGTNAAAASSTIAPTNSNSVSQSLRGSSSPPMPSLDESLVALVNTLATVKAEAAIRQASAAALLLPAATPPGIEAPQLQTNADSASKLASLLSQQGGTSSQGDENPQVTLARALALSAQSSAIPTPPPAVGAQSPNSMSLLESLLNSGAAGK